MDSLRQFIHTVLHINQSLEGLIGDYGPWVYGLMFLVIFCETGLVVTPFLPGDSLLFALGVFAAKGSLSLTLLFALLTVAAILGDSANYGIGAIVGKRIFSGERIRFLNPKHLQKTHDFYEKYGGKTIILARFVPIVRTFAPFVAGAGRMTYRKFMLFNVVGGVVWIFLFLIAGYFFAQFDWVQKNFGLVEIAIIVISVMPMVIEIIRERRKLRQAMTSSP